jgi:hypothetical protein
VKSVVIQGSGAVNCAYAAQIRRPDRETIWEAAPTLKTCERRWHHYHLGLPMRLRSDRHSFGQPYEGRSDEIVRLLAGREFQSTEQRAWDVGHRHLVFLERNAKALRQPKRSTVSSLRGSRHQGLCAVARFSQLPARHGADMDQWSDAGTHRREWRLRAGELSLGDQIRTTPKSPSVIGMEKAVPEASRQEGKDASQ